MTHLFCAFEAFCLALHRDGFFFLHLLRSIFLQSGRGRGGSHLQRSEYRERRPFPLRRTVAHSPHLIPSNEQHLQRLKQRPSLTFSAIFSNFPQTAIQGWNVNLPRQFDIVISSITRGNGWQDVQTNRISFKMN